MISYCICVCLYRIIACSDGEGTVQSVDSLKRSVIDVDEESPLKKQKQHEIR